MDIAEMPKLIVPNYVHIGGIIPKNELTLIAGLAGVGKTYTLVKFLNMNQITPVIVNLDYAPLNKLACLQYGEVFLDHAFIKDDITGLTDRVVIIDTYQRLADYLISKFKKITNSEIVRLLETFVKKNQCTLIIIGHPEDYIGKDGVFKDNPVLVRNAAEYIHIDQMLPRAKNGTTTDIIFQTTIKKGRANGGTRIIQNWLREPMLNPLTNQMC